MNLFEGVDRAVVQRLRRLIHSGVVLLRLAGCRLSPEPMSSPTYVAGAPQSLPEQSASSRPDNSASAGGLVPERFSESVVDEAALAWLGDLGDAVRSGPEIAAGEPDAERSGQSPSARMSATTRAGGKL